MAILKTIKHLRISVISAATFGCVALLFVLIWIIQPNFRTTKPDDLKFRVTQVEATVASPSIELITKLQRETSIGSHVDRSETPRMILVELSPSLNLNTNAIYLPSRHATKVNCWQSDLSKSDGNWNPVPTEANFLNRSIDGSQIEGATHLACHITTIGTGKIVVQLGTAKSIDANAAQLRQTSFVLIGAIGGLALFCAIVSSFGRESVFAFFSIWLVFSLQLGLIAIGSDSWFIPTDALARTLEWSRKLTGTGYIVTLVLLYEVVLSKFSFGKLKRKKNPILIFASVGICIAAFFPMKHFLPAMWLLAFLVVPVMVYGVWRTWSKHRNRSLLWLGASWTLILLTSVVEIVAASGSFLVVNQLLNHANSLVISSFMIAVSLSEAMRYERDERIAAEKNASNLLHQKNRTYNSVPVGLATISFDGELLASNPTFNKGNFSSSDIRLIASSITNPTSQSQLNKCDSELTTHIELPSGENLFSITVHRTETELEVIARDVTIEKLADEKLKFVADHDSLLGIYNRRRILEELSERIGLQENSTQPPNKLNGIVLFDIHAFDRVVSVFGHGIGDQVLLAYRDRLLSVFDTNSSLGRLSADTLIAIVRLETEQELAKLTNAALHELNSKPFNIDKVSIAIHVSAATRLFNHHDNMSDLLASCDFALAKAKSEGEGRAVHFNEVDQLWIAKRSDELLISEFIRTFPEDRLFLMFQPIADLSNPNDYFAYEVLVRMTGVGGETIPPGRFLPAFEREGLMSHLDSWVIQELIRIFEKTPEHFERLSRVSVNLSGASLNDDKFKKTLTESFALHPKIFSKVCFELTETIAIQSFESVRNFILDAHKAGSTIALDDFGAGYASFGYLAELDVDSIKIDGQLIRGIALDSKRQALVKAIVSLSQSLDKKLVAEYMEDEATIEAVRQLGVNLGQGYGIARPLSVAKVLRANSPIDLFEESFSKSLSDIKVAM